MEDEINEVEIYNVLGIRLHNETFDGKTEKTIDMSGFENGTYFVRIITEKEVKTIKVNKI